MNSRERFITALELKKPDRVPFFEWYINKNVIKGIEGKDMGIEDFVDKWDMDAITVYGNYKKEYIDDNTYIDEWGITRKVVNEEYPITLDHPVKEKVDFKNYKFPDPDFEHIYKDLISAVRRFKGKRAILFRVNDVLTLPRNLRGFENFLVDTIDDEKFAKRLINQSLEYNIQLSKNAARYGADVVGSTDDYCDNRGPFISPDTYYKLFFPGLKTLVENVKDLGMYFIKHTDGNVLKIMDFIIKAGCHAYDPIDITAGMDLSYFKKKFGKKICLIGNVDGAAALQYGDKEDTIRDVFRCLLDGAEDGGYIMRSSTDIHSNVKPENFTAMMETVKHYGTYPINKEDINKY